MADSNTGDAATPQANGQHAASQDVEMSETIQHQQNGELLQPGQPQTLATPVSPNGDISTPTALQFPDASVNGITPVGDTSAAASHASLAADSQMQHPSPEQPVRYSSATESQPLSAQPAPLSSQPRQSASSALLDNSLPASVPIPPVNPAGSPTRVYINQKVTPVLLEGMKYIAANEPEKPLTWLGDFLLKKAKELE